jgi:hypothetical protein
MTLRPLQTWFEKMSSRERSMLLAVAWSVVILWGFMLFGQVTTLKKNISDKNKILATQKSALDQKPKVEAQLSSYKKQFAVSVSGPELVSRVTKYYKEAGVPAPGLTQNHTDTKKETIFNVNSVTVHFQKVDWYSLLFFTEKVLADNPNLIIDELVTNPERIDPRQMSGTMTILSLELKPGALDVSASAASMMAPTSAAPAMAAK